MVYLLSADTTAVLFAASSPISSVDAVTQEPLHFTWWNFARTRTLTSSRNLWILRSSVKGQGCVFFLFCVYETAATRGQYLALSKAWRSCCGFVVRCGSREASWWTAAEVAISISIYSSSSVFLMAKYFLKSVRPRALQSCVPQHQVVHTHSMNSLNFNARITPTDC